MLKRLSQPLWISALALTMGVVMLAGGPADAKHYRYIDAYVARDIAFDTGIVEIKEMELDDGIWEIEGWDARHKKIELELDARSGGIVKIERD
ncbi:MAG: PepSY domain-containing protein [Methyloligella sp. ZOD6]